VLRSAAEALEPHRVCQFAYDLAVAYSAFYDACPVLKAEGGAGGGGGGAGGCGRRVCGCAT
jgi:arginyl-tRNA synthetase